MAKYDIFISYRRKWGAQFARILQLKLLEHGYKVFLDYDELKDSKFDSQIKDAIREAPIFMLMLSRGALMMCKNDDDWVSQEIRYANSLQKVFIIINPDKEFNGFPQDIPQDIKDIIAPIQYSDIDFGRELDISVDSMVDMRIAKYIGKRIKPKVFSQTEFASEKVSGNLENRLNNPLNYWWNKFKLAFQDSTALEIQKLIDEYKPHKVDFGIFISYRRIDGRDSGRNIQQALKGRGYKHVFFDYDSIQKGEFTKRIIDAIYSCSDFIILLSPKSMKRCAKTGDPVANEIRTAVKYHKNIIPVTLDGREIKWPRNLPDDLQFIKGLQFHDHKSDSYFEDSIDKLCTKLTCKPTN